MMKKIISLSILSFLSNFSYSLGTLDPKLDSIVEREYNSRIAQPEMSHREIKQGVYLIKCNTVCGNSLLVYGKDGGILINSMLAKTLPWLRKEIRDISGINNIKILITTNAHFWNSNANGLFGGMMDFMISHKNTRKRILSNSVIEDLQILPGYSQERHVDNAGARVTFLDEMELNFNQEKVDLIHLKGASTDGDILIFFKKKNIIHLGDLVLNNGFPFINNDFGGSTTGLMIGLKKALDLGNEETTFIPGLGNEMSYKELSNYISKLNQLLTHIKLLKSSSLSYEKILQDETFKEISTNFQENFISNKESFLKQALR